MNYTELTGHWLLGRRFAVDVIDIAGHKWQTTARVIGAWIRGGDTPKHLPVLLRYRRWDKRPIVMHLEIEGTCPEGCSWLIPARTTSSPRRHRTRSARLLPRAA